MPLNEATKKEDAMTARFMERFEAGLAKLAAGLTTPRGMLTDLESVFRSLKSELGLRPIFHHKEERAEGHLFITVLAYQAIQTLRLKLKMAGDENSFSWKRLREIFGVQQRITATFKQRDNKTLHIRKTTVAEPTLKKLYDRLEISSSPGGMQKMVVEG